MSERRWRNSRLNTLADGQAPRMCPLRIICPLVFRSLNTLADGQAPRINTYAYLDSRADVSQYPR